MNALIPMADAVVGGSIIKTVCARELHAFLDVGRDFSTWFKERAGRLGFLENRDYVAFPESGERENQGLRGRVEYAVSVRMAKHLALAENNDRGRQARDYFIRCEEQLQQAQAVAFPVPTTFAAALRLAAEQAEQIEALQLTNEQQAAAIDAAAPKVRVFDRLLETSDTFCLREASKQLDLPEKKFIALLEAMNFIYRTDKRKPLPYAHHREKGPFIVRPDQDRDGNVRPALRVTAKGLAYFADRVTHRQGCLLFNEPGAPAIA